MVTLVNRAKVGTSTTGTGTITLGSAESGYQTFADAGVTDGDVVRYVIEDGDSWEIGSGTYSAGTLTRTVSESSNADAAINLSGEAVVYVTAAAADIVQPSDLATVATTGAYSDLSGLPTLYSNASVDAHLNTSTASSGEVLSWTGTDYDWIAAGGGGAALELYAENPSSPTAPSATGTNAVAIGSGAVASGTDAVSMGRTATAVGADSVSLGRSRAGGASSFAAVVDSTSTSYGATNTSAIAIGATSRATSSSAVGIGYLARASGGSSVAIGNGAYASGFESIALGDSDASASNAIAIGEACVAGNFYSVALGLNAQSNVRGKLAYASGRFSGNGDAQSGAFVLRSDTTDATPEALTTINNAGGLADSQIILPNNSAYAFHGTIVARQQASAGTACAAWKIEGLIRREGSAGTTVLVNSATTVLDNTPGWGMALSADTTNGGLKIEVTGAAATNIRWVATVHTSEVTY